MKRAKNGVDAEAALQHILDATVKAGGVLSDDFRRDLVWNGIVLACRDWVDRTQRVNSYMRSDSGRRLRRIVSAARVIERELSALGLPASIAQIIEREIEDKILTLRSFQKYLNENPLHAALLTNSIFPIVGQLVAPFEQAFPVSPKYTTADSGTDGPFIRFVEQAFCEFGITKDGNQPYMRSAIAAALNEFKKLPRAIERGKTARRE